jgi:hypothetical protein
MMYKEKTAVCSEIRTQHSTQSEHHIEFLNVNHLAPEFSFKRHFEERKTVILKHF